MKNFLRNLWLGFYKPGPFELLWPFNSFSKDRYFFDGHNNNTLFTFVSFVTLLFISGLLSWLIALVYWACLAYPAAKAIVIVVAICLSLVYLLRPRTRPPEPETAVQDIQDNKTATVYSDIDS